MAVSRGNTEITELLARHGAKLGFKNRVRDWFVEYNRLCDCESVCLVICPIGIYLLSFTVFLEWIDCI